MVTGLVAALCGTALGALVAFFWRWPGRAPDGAIEEVVVRLVDRDA